jgi:hypothetical protein
VYRPDVGAKALDTVLAEHGIPATVTCDAGYLAGVLDATRADSARLCSPPSASARTDLWSRTGLPVVPPIRMSAHARPGADGAMVTHAISVVRDLLRSTTTGFPNHR